MNPIVLHEVGPRDGLQMEKQIVSTAKKESWIRKAMAAGMDIVQVGSFVHPDKVPPMADTDRLFHRLLGGAPRTAVLSALVLNEKGPSAWPRVRGRALLHGGLGQRDPQPRQHRPRERGGRDPDPRHGPEGRRRGRRSSVQSAFGCGFEGQVPEERVLEMVRAYVGAGFRSISLADTAGHARPDQVERLYGASLGWTRRSRPPAISTTPTASGWRTSMPRCAPG